MNNMLGKQRFVRLCLRALVELSHHIQKRWKKWHLRENELSAFEALWR